VVVIMANASAAPATWSETVTRVLGEHRERPGALLPILHGIQHALGYVPPDSVETIARSLNLSRAEVHGVITFYHEFRSTPPGAHVVKLCRAESCQAVGADALVAHAEQRLGVTLHHTTADGQVTLEPIYCLGNCALSPAMMVDGQVHGLVTPARFDAVVRDLGASA
jgi:formate dehydrogenase subunit gamma